MDTKRLLLLIGAVIIGGILAIMLGPDKTEVAEVDTNNPANETSMPRDGVEVVAPTILGTHVVDESSSQVSWSAKLLLGTRGHVGIVPVAASNIIVENGMVTGGEVSMNMVGITADNDRVQDHLQTDDFFDTAKYPTSKFVITDITAKGGDMYDVTGNMTILGSTQQITVPLMITESNNTLHVTGDVTLSRSAYGITFRSVGDNAIADEIEIGIDFTVVPL